MERIVKAVEFLERPSCDIQLAEWSSEPQTQKLPSDWPNDFKAANRLASRMATQLWKLATGLRIDRFQSWYQHPQKASLVQTCVSL